MVSKDIQIQTETGEVMDWSELDGIDFGDTGIEEVKPYFPNVKVVQGSSGMAGASKHGGHFWHSDSQEFSEDLDIVPMLRRETRALFGTGDSKPMCTSNDGKFPLDNQRLWDGRHVISVGEGDSNIRQVDVPKVAPNGCANCVFSEWPKGGKPVCPSSDVWLVNRGTDEKPDLAQLRLSGMSIGPMIAWVKREVKPRSLAPFFYRLRLSNKEHVEGTRKWQDLVVESTKRTPREIRATGDLLNRYRAEFDDRPLVEPTKDAWEEEA